MIRGPTKENRRPSEEVERRWTEDPDITASAVLRLGGTTHKQQRMTIGIRCRNDGRHFEYSPPIVGACAAQSLVY
jgi:hypothetical protein